MQCQCYRMQWNGLLLRPCSGSWKTFSRCRTQSTRTPPPTDLRLGTRPSLCIISSLLYCRQYTTVSIIRTYCDIRQLIINCNVESWVIFWALSKLFQCLFERWVTPFLLSPAIKNEMKCYCYYLISIVLDGDCLFLLLQFQRLKLIFIYSWQILSTPTGPYQVAAKVWPISSINNIFT